MKKTSAVGRGRDTVHVVLLCPVPGWPEEEEAKLQQRGSVRGGVGGQRRLCTSRVSLLMCYTVDFTLTVGVYRDLQRLEGPHSCRLSDCTSRWINDPRTNFSAPRLSSSSYATPW